MKYIILILMVVLFGCGGGDPTAEPINKNPDIYIVAGQSNANVCDWLYFEDLTGSTVIKIAVGSSNIDRLMELYEPIITDKKSVKGIIFVHGENDSLESTPPEYYISQVENYRKMISADIGYNLPMYISTVGYSATQPDIKFDLIRDAVRNYEDPNWVIAFDEAFRFRDWGWLRDTIHFNQDACRLMIEGIANTVSMSGS